MVWNNGFIQYADCKQFTITVGSMAHLLAIERAYALSVQDLV
jgi:hypothetical protein